VDKEQRIRVAVVIRALPSAPPDDSAVDEKARQTRCAVRATFQRVICNTRNEVSRAELMADPELYRAFFDQFAWAVLLETQEI